MISILASENSETTNKPANQGRQSGAAHDRDSERKVDQCAGSAARQFAKRRQADPDVDSDDIGGQQACRGRPAKRPGANAARSTDRIDNRVRHMRHPQCQQVVRAFLPDVLVH